MSWALLALLSAIAFSLGNVTEKIAINKYFKSAASLTAINGIFAFIAAMIVLVFGNIFGQITLLPLELLITCIITGIIWMTLTFLYFKSLAIEEVSRIIPLFSIAPIFVLIAATFLYGEIFSLWRYIGIFSIIAGAILVSLKKKVTMRISKAFWLMLLAAILWAIVVLIGKNIVMQTNILNAFFWIAIGMSIVTPFLLYSEYTKIKAIVKENPIALGYVSFADSLDMIGKFLIIGSLFLGTASLVSALNETQPFFVFLFALLISIYSPRLLKEERKRSVIYLKIIAIVLIFVGLILII